VNVNRLPPENAPAASAFSVRMIWKWLASLKLAIGLMLALVALSLIGTFVIQIPSEYAVSLQSQAWWLENIAKAQTGAWYPFLKAAGFFDLFHSFWFIAGSALLVINILVCNLNRWKKVRAILSPRPPVATPEAFRSDPAVRIIAGFEDLAGLRSFLQKRGYYTLSSEAGGEKYLAAVKYRWAALGSYLLHFSLILFILGFVIGHALGFENSSFSVAEGQTRAVGNGTGLELELNSFQAQYYPDGSAQNFTSLVTLRQNQKEVKTGEIQVNHPLRYQGVRFFQSYFGPAAGLRVDRQGQTLFAGMVALDSLMDNHPYTRPAGLLALNGSEYSIYLVAPATNLADPALQPNQLGLEVYAGGDSRALAATTLNLDQTAAAGDLEITFTGHGRYSGFLVNSDPGAGFIWTAAAFLLTGLIIVFYFQRRQLRAACLPGSGPQGDLYLRWEGPGGDSSDAHKLTEFLTGATTHQPSGPDKEN
jgi:cytochrome c biogenesis protein